MIFLTMASVQVFFSREGLNGANHLVVGFPRALKRTRARIINVVLFSNAVHPVDAGIPALQVFLQMVPGPMYWYPGQ